MLLSHHAVGIPVRSIESVRGLKGFVEEYSVRRMEWVYWQMLNPAQPYDTPEQIVARKKDVASILNTTEDIKIFYDLFLDLERKHNRLENYVFEVTDGKKQENLERLLKKSSGITDLMDLFGPKDQQFTRQRLQRKEQLTEFIRAKLNTPESPLKEGRTFRIF